MNTNRLNSRQIATAVAQRLEFSNSTGSLKGYPKTDDYYPGDHMTGRLDPEERAKFLSDTKHGITYLVVSYNTPIAWVCEDGSTYKVSQKFSPTTSRHMGSFSL